MTLLIPTVTSCAGALLLLLGAALNLPAPATAQAPSPPHVVGFNPQGVVKNVRQVTARFSAPMVPLGDPRPATDVFEVACPEAGSARCPTSHPRA